MKNNLTICSCIFLSFYFLNISKTFANSFSFYGEGVGQFLNDNSQSKDAFRPFFLSTDFGESETAYITFHDLKPGYYKIKSKVAALDVQKGVDGYSFWNFYDAGFGTKMVFTDLYGNFGKREIEFSVAVKNTEMTIWYRLKSPGKIIVSSFEITPMVKKSSSVLISPPPAIAKTDFPEKKKVSPKQAQRVHLFHFDSVESGHPFKVTKDVKNNGIGTFMAHKYLNFSLDDVKNKDWSTFDRIEFDVFNPFEDTISFNFTLADEQTTNYWSQLNHNESLGPGWNHLSLSLNQYVGERGSVKVYRRLDLKKITRIFMIVGNENESKYSNKSFFIDNVDLVQSAVTQVPKSVWAFDFTSEKSIPTNFNFVTTQTIYNKQRGYGFVNPKFWRVEDSKYASENLRYTIGLLGGKFKVNVPNGKYQISLILDQLGFWDVPFYKDRTVFVNGHPIYKETRNSGREFLADLLRFETVRATKSDNPYDLYYAKIFKPIEKVVTVINGVIEFEFSGDPSAISLNTLLFWNLKDNKIGIEFQKSFDARNKLEFSWFSRALSDKKKISPTNKLEINVVDSDAKLPVGEIKKILSNKLHFQLGRNEVSSLLLQVNPLLYSSTLNLKIGDLKNSKNEVIKKSVFTIQEVMNQYVSPGLNHETYFLGGKFLYPIAQNQVLLEKNESKYLWTQVENAHELTAGIYHLDIEASIHDQKVIFPVTIEILPYELPKVKFPVGFMGLDSLPYSYYSGAGYKELRRKNRNLVLQEIVKAGFTTFSGLPEVQLKIASGKIQLETSELDEILNLAKYYNLTGPFFSYGGQFPDALIKSIPPGMTEEDYFLQLGKLLKPYSEVVYFFSDEASGYSDKVETDLAFGNKLKKYFPSMSLGGFGSFKENNNSLDKLNSLFDYGFFSNLFKNNIDNIKSHKKKWGMYNGAQGALDDPRFLMGPGLYMARKEGLDHYLEWNSIGFNNYPYLDFDGRESDVVTFYPSVDGSIHPTIRFLLARDGLTTFRKLMLIEEIANGKTPRANVAKRFLDNLSKDMRFSFTASLILKEKNQDFVSFNSNLDSFLLNLYK